MLPPYGLVYPQGFLSSTGFGGSLSTLPGEVTCGNLGTITQNTVTPEDKVRDALVSSQIHLMKLQTMEKILQLQKQLVETNQSNNLPLAMPPMDLLSTLVSTNLANPLPLSSLNSLPFQTPPTSGDFGQTASQRSESPKNVVSPITVPTNNLTLPKLPEWRILPKKTETTAGGKRSYARAFRPRLCTVEGCTTQDKGGGLCAKHGGGKPCAFEGCAKRVAGTRFCSAHGGTRKKRCTFPNCTKGDQGGGFCAAHGGGKRCTINGCTKRAVGKGLCWSHGGGKRCKFAGCSKSPSAHGICSQHLRQLESKVATL